MCLNCHLIHFLLKPIVLFKLSWKLILVSVLLRGRWASHIWRSTVSTAVWKRILLSILLGGLFIRIHILLLQWLWLSISVAWKVIWDNPFRFRYIASSQVFTITHIISGQMSEHWRLILALRRVTPHSSWDVPWIISSLFCSINVIGLKRSVFKSIGRVDIDLGVLLLFREWSYTENFINASLTGLWSILNTCYSLVITWCLLEI